MGNSISQQRLVPNSLLECFDREGNFDVKLFFLYEWQERLEKCYKLAEEEMELNPPKFRQRGKKC